MAQPPIVLVVEDEPTVQRTLAATLTMLGFHARPASDIEQALRILGAEHVDAITLDVRLPDPKGLQRTGLTLLSFLRATPDYRTMPVVVFTGVLLSPEEEELVRRHHAEVFYKPQPYTVLAGRLSLALGIEPVTPEISPQDEDPSAV